MEKLQQALDKARAAREGALSGEGAPEGAPPRQGTPATGAPRKATAPREANVAREGNMPREATAGAEAGPLPERRGSAPNALWGELAQLNPEPATLKRNRIVALDAGSSATPFDILRTKVLLQMRKSGWRRLAITSPMPSCGKTTMSLNLAAGLSRQPDMTAMVLEMDMRRPGMASKLGYKPEHDVTQMLSGEIPFGQQAVRMRGNVALSLARRASNDPTRYMLSHETIRTLDALERDYAPDLMIFDLPPLLVSDDTRAFLSNVDCVLMVARAGGSSIAEIDVCEREIAEQTNMLGVVLNSCRFSDESTAYDFDGS